jgi:hypothetical protein
VPFADLLRALPGIEAPVEGAERGGDPASGFGSSMFRAGRPRILDPFLDPIANDSAKRLKSLALPTGRSVHDQKLL